MTLGPVELLVLTFSGDTVGAGVADALAEVVAKGDVTVLDLLFVAKDEAGDLRVVELEDQPDGYGLADLVVDARALVNDEDAEVVAEALDPGTSAAFIVYEHTWARRVAQAVSDAGGEVALHVHVPRETAAAALAAATG
jgi:hypothetical protein